MDETKAKPPNSHKPRESKYERLVYSILSSLGYAFDKQSEIDSYAGLAGRRHKYDALIRDKGIAIEVDGCWYHGCKKCFPQSRPWQLEARRRDLQIDRYTRRSGWKIIRIKIHDLRVEPQRAVERALERSRQSIS